MALINCPECGKQISDKALSCPNCGFPIQTNSQENKTLYNVELISIGNNDDKIRTVRFLREVKGIGLAEAVKILDNLPQNIFTNLTKEVAEKTIKTLKSFNNNVNIKPSEDLPNALNDEDLNIYFETKNNPLVCPVCNSTNITTGQRGYSFVTGFLGSKKTVNRCGQCGHTWVPSKII